MSERKTDNGRGLSHRARSDSCSSSDDDDEELSIVIGLNEYNERQENLGDNLNIDIHENEDGNEGIRVMPINEKEETIHNLMPPIQPTLQEDQLSTPQHTQHCSAPSG